MKIALAESLWRLGQLPINAARPLAIAALAEGYSGPALFELADGGYGTWREIEATFAQALIELGRTPLTEREAAEQAAWCLCEEIADGEIEPYTGADKIRQLISVLGYSDHFYRLAYFEEIYGDYQGVRRDNGAEIRELARDLLAER